MADIAQQFAGLPIEDLIVSPLVGMAKGQAKLNDVTWKYISEVAFEPVDPSDPKNLKKKTRFLDVQLNRYVTNPDTGAQELQMEHIQTFNLKKMIMLFFHLE